jgi:hypothetical protein
MRFLLGSLILCLGFLAACSAGGPRFTAPAAPSDKAVVYVFRPSSVVGGANTDLIAFNDKPVAVLDNGEYIPVEVDPGPVKVSFRQKLPWIALSFRLLQEIGGYSEMLTIDAQPGKTYFLELSQVELVGAERAASRIGGMTQVPPPAERAE